MYEYMCVVACQKMGRVLCSVHAFIFACIQKNVRTYTHTYIHASQTRVSCGALSGLMAVNVVYPFDVVRRRMQMHEGHKVRVYILKYACQNSVQNQFLY